MKHIKKKYYYQEKRVPIQEGREPIKADRRDNKNLKKLKKGNIPFIKTTEGEFIMSMSYNYNGTEAIIPLPDLTLIYYNNAYLNNISRKSQEKKLFEKLLNGEDELTENVTNELYNYVGVATSSIIQMFTSLESFINHQLPDEIPYIYVRKDKTEYYNKEQIQMYIKFWDKVKEVLPYYHSKNFFQNVTPTNSHIRNLKDLRDEIVHTKSNQLYDVQAKLIEKLLKFKYDETLIAIRKFMNFYDENYIIDCNCKNDF